MDSASYVASYAVKKIVGKKEVVDAHYKGKTPEFVLMSRRPGIGRGWFERFTSDVYPSDEVVVRGVSTRPPRYYDELYKVRKPDSFRSIQERRERQASKLEEMVLRDGSVVGVAPGNNARRLEVREKVARAKLALKRRTLESD